MNSRIFNRSAITAALLVGASTGEPPASTEHRVPEDEIVRSPLIGNWVSVMTMGLPGPTHIDVITINEDGVYHWVKIQAVPKKGSVGTEPLSYVPVGAELEHQAGRIDLKTGVEEVSEEDRRLSVQSIRWTMEGDTLRWVTDMGGVGMQGVRLTRAYNGW